jgi:hypothetical protein
LTPPLFSCKKFIDRSVFEISAAFQRVLPLCSIIIGFPKLDRTWVNYRFAGFVGTAAACN